MTMLTIVGMMIVTMVPRFIPAFIMDRIALRPWLSKWLNAIPFAALGALIFPGVMTVIEGDPWIGIAGGLVAAAIALLNLNVIFSVIGAIVAVYLLTM